MAVDPPRLYIALYTDQDVDAELAQMIRAEGHDAISTYEAGNAGQSDREQLQYAAQHQRALLTHNSKHFDPLFNEFAEQRFEHYGLITSQQLHVGEMLRRVLRLLDSVSAEEMKGNYKNLGEFK
jgi:hypothetical protein